MARSVFRCAECDLVFEESSTIKMFGEVVQCCPRATCHAPDIDWDLFSSSELSARFMTIIAQSFDEQERFMLRDVSETYMGPFNPLSRDV